MLEALNTTTTTMTTARNCTAWIFIVEQRKKARITRYSYTMNTRRARKKTSRQPTSNGRQTNRLGAVATLAIFGGKRRRQPPTGNWQRVRVPSALKFTSCFMATHGQEKSGHAQQHTHTHILTHTRWHMQQNIRVAGTLLLLSSFYEKVFSFLSFSFFCFFSSSWLQAAVKFYWDYLEGTSNGYWYWLIVKNLYSRTFTNTEPWMPHAGKYSSEYSYE